MEIVQMLIPIDPKDFWKMMRELVEEIMLEQSKKAVVDPRQKRPLLKVADVCEIFHISKPTIYDWMKQGRISPVKIRSKRYFHWEDVHSLIDKNRVMPKQAKFSRDRLST